jgi:hypothetical protein
VGELQPRALSTLRESKLEYILLGSVVRRGLLGRRRASLTPEQLAAAVDAADDLSGGPRLELNLDDERAWRALKLPPPGA